MKNILNDNNNSNFTENNIILYVNMILKKIK